MTHSWILISRVRNCEVRVIQGRWDVDLPSSVLAPLHTRARLVVFSFQDSLRALLSPWSGCCGRWELTKALPNWEQWAAVAVILHWWLWEFYLPLESFLSQKRCERIEVVFSSVASFPLPSSPFGLLKSPDYLNSERFSPSTPTASRSLHSFSSHCSSVLTLTPFSRTSHFPRTVLFALSSTPALICF